MRRYGSCCLDEDEDEFHCHHDTKPVHYSPFQALIQLQVIYEEWHGE
ncbi:hypothetical protein QQ054_23045 [Oscillatoria amoena NRMC-F 0135]|nr:hypothetical protein [Oscillatoria amoena NRMC-F 0135]